MLRRTAPGKRRKVLRLTSVRALCGWSENPTDWKQQFHGDGNYLHIWAKTRLSSAGHFQH